MTRIALVGEAYGENEENLRLPFVGAAGIELFQMLSDAGVVRASPSDLQAIEDFWKRGRDPINVALLWSAHAEEFFLTNVFNLRPDSRNDILALCGNKAETQSQLPPLRPGKYLHPKYLGELSRLADELRSERPNIIVALGNTAAWALVRNTSITKIRGTIFPCTLVEGLKVLPTFHPAGVLRQYDLRAVTVLDLAKAKRESTFPEIRRPRRNIYVPENLADLEEFWNENLLLAETIAVDIETSGKQITCIGFSARTDTALVIPIIDNRRTDGSYWPSLEEECKVWEFIRRVLQHPAKKVFQNGLYDLHFLYRGYGMMTRNCEHDTMLLHHSLQPESSKGLGFMGSVYTDEPAWKLMRERGKKSTKREE